MVALSLDMIPDAEDFVWQELALCDGLAFYYDPSDHPFFAEGYGSTYREVRPYCASCPVVVDCLLYIIDDRGAEGFWGSTTPNERTNIRRHLDNGVNFKTAVERIWSVNRGKNIPVPPKKVWDDWDL